MNKRLSILIEYASILEEMRFFDKVDKENLSRKIKNYKSILNIDGTERVVKISDEALRENDYLLRDLLSQIDIDVTSKHSTVNFIHPDKLKFNDISHPTVKKSSEITVNDINVKDIINTSLNPELSLLKYLHIYGSTLNSSIIYGYNDISYYDLAKLQLNELLDIGKKCWLLKFEFSGIQKYIARNLFKSSGNPAKKLRGRSVLISLLTEVLVNGLLNKFDLSITNVIFNTGGNGLLILPGLIDKILIEDELRKLSNEIDKLFAGELIFLFAVTDTTYTDINSNYKDIYNNLSYKIEEYKFRQPYKDDKAVKEIAYNRNTLYQLEEEVESKIGELYPKNDVFILSNVEIQQKGIECIKIDPLNKYFCFTNYKTANNVDGSKDTTYYQYRLIENSDDLITTKFIILETGNHVELDSRNNVENFENLAGIQINNESNFDNISVNQLLGVLRLDVDDLGFIFTRGFDKISNAKYHIARLHSLSRSLNHFFSSEVNRLAIKYRIYIGYSGGDDVFAVGNWLNISKFTSELQISFKKFSGENNNLRVSAGISVIKPKFPVNKAANFASELEHMAKHESDDKNRVAIFNSIVTWEQFKNCLSESDKIISITKSDDSKEQSISFLYQLLNIIKKLIDNSGNLYPQKADALIKYAFARRGLNNEYSQKMHTNDISDSAGVSEFVKTLSKYFINTKDDRSISKKEIRSQFNVLSHFSLYRYRQL